MRLATPRPARVNGLRLTWIKWPTTRPAYALHTANSTVFEENKMQFELSTSDLDATVLAAALQPVDPDARIAFDAENGSLEVMSTATVVQVQDALQAMGYPATLLEKEVHISGGSTCCGGCS